MPSPSLLQRLKQRKLVQWALAYLAGGWVLFEVSDAVGGRLGWPDVLYHGLLVLLGIGFFVTLVLAWYHGEKGRQRVSGPELLMVAALLVVAGVVLWQFGQGGDPSAPSTPEFAASDQDEVPRIAVLLCENRSPDSADQYLADGFHDEILHYLQGVSSLRPIGRTSVVRFAQDPPTTQEIASALGAGFIGECSFRKALDRIRLSFRLLEGSTGGQLWTGQYDTTLALPDLFDIESEIAKQVVWGIGSFLTPEDEARLAAVPTLDPVARDLYQRGTSELRHLTKEGFERAIDFFSRAIDRDSAFALAYAGLAEAYNQQGIWYHRPGSEVFPLARQHAQRALALDGTLATAHAALAMVQLRLEWDWEAAERSYRRAIELNHNLAQAHLDYGYLLGYSGRWRETPASTSRRTMLRWCTLVWANTKRPWIGFELPLTIVSRA